MHECFAHMYVSIPPVCLVPLEVRRGPQISKNWSYGWLWVSLWVLGIELWSSIRTTLVLNGWAIFPAGVLSNLYLNAQWGRLLINSKRSSCPLTLSLNLPCSENPLHILTYSKCTNTETRLINSPQLHSFFVVLLWWLLLIISYMNEYHGDIPQMSY